MVDDGKNLLDSCPRMRVYCPLKSRRRCPFMISFFLVFFTCYSFRLISIAVLQAGGAHKSVVGITRKIDTAKARPIDRASILVGRLYVGCDGRRRDIIQREQALNRHEGPFQSLQRVCVGGGGTAPGGAPSVLAANPIRYLCLPGTSEGLHEWPL